MSRVRKFSLQKLFFNNKFVFVFSVVLAFFIWASVVIFQSPDDTRTVEGIKVNVQNKSAESGEYKMFGFDESMTVDVTVSGKRYAISSAAISPEDIAVTAKSGFIDSAGVYTLNITAEPADPNAAFDIVSVSKTSVSVFFDTLKSEEFNVKASLKNKKKVPDGYIYDDPISSLSTVTVEGPATEINKIEKIVAKATLASPVTETTDIKADVVALTANNATLNYITFKEDTTSCTVTLPVYMKKEIPLAMRYVNLPAAYADAAPVAEIYPDTLTVAAAKNVIEEMNVLYIGTLDFNNITAEVNELEIKASDIEEVKILDDIDTISVTVDFSDLETKTFSIPAANITCLNLDKKFIAKPSGIKEVTVVGPSDSLESLTESNINASIDFTNIKAHEGRINAPAEIFIKGFDDCWITGKYTASVELSAGK
ncbi:MAG: YbbR-like domain-containing protein [Clostridia bacterium]|nr:YbbR-like domain-containing protein [Clostridia bacterium]